MSLGREPLVSSPTIFFCQWRAGNAQQVVGAQLTRVALKTASHTVDAKLGGRLSPLYLRFERVEWCREVHRFKSEALLHFVQHSQHARKRRHPVIDIPHAYTDYARPTELAALPGDWSY